MPYDPPPLPWLQPGQAFPPAYEAWGTSSPAPGLLAGGGSLDTATLIRAYQGGIFPWYSHDDPVMWWSPDPRMVLSVARFKLHPSLRKTLRQFRARPHCEIRIDTSFTDVIQACSEQPRRGQSGTWIVSDMVMAYRALHDHGVAHSVETWIDGQLAGGLYLVAVGRAVFGESMFARRTDASKIALAALVAFCRWHDITWIDCQQNTRHLTSLGAAEIPRSEFLIHVSRTTGQTEPPWAFDPIYWDTLLTPTASPP